MVPSLSTLDTVKVLTAVFVIWICQALLRRLVRRRKYRLPPGPGGLPLVGRVTLDTHRALWDHRDKYGDVSYFSVFGTDLVIFNSVDVIRDAYLSPRTAEVLSERAPSFAQEYFVPNDIAMQSMTTDGWKSARQIFHSLLKQYGGGIAEIESVVSNELDFVLKKLVSQIGKEIDMKAYLHPSLVNILLILLIGERYDYDSWEVSVGPEMLRLLAQIAQPFQDIALRKIFILKYLPFGPGLKFKRVMEVKSKLLNFLYRDLKGLPLDVRESRKGLVYELLRLRKTKPFLTDSRIEGIVLDTFGAGFITTESSLRAFFLILLHYQDVQFKIQEEIDAVVDNGRRPAVSDRAYMPYTVASILELSRYSSIVPTGVPHSCKQDTEFRGFTIPRGSMIVSNMMRVNHDEKTWENPSKFDPTRFLDDSGGLLPADHSTRKNLIPFGVGKRLCLGEKFAKTRMFLYATYLLQAFTFKPTDHLPSCRARDYEPEGVLDPPDYKVYIERRNPQSTSTL